MQKKVEMDLGKMFTESFLDIKPDFSGSSFDFEYFLQEFKKTFNSRKAQLNETLKDKVLLKEKKNGELILACFKSLLCFFVVLEDFIFVEKMKSKQEDQKLHLQRSKWVVFSDLLLVLIHHFVLKTSYNNKGKEQLLIFFTNILEEMLQFSLKGKSIEELRGFLEKKMNKLILKTNG